MKYVVVGRILPERANVNLSRTDFRSSDGSVSYLQCDASQFTVVLNDNEVKDAYSAKIRGEQMALMIVSALGFSNGSGYSVEVIQVVDEEGNSFVFGVRPYSPELGTDLKIEPMDQVCTDAIRLSGHNIFSGWL